MNVNRRIFLKQGALAFVCIGAGPMWGPKFLRQTAFAAELGSQRDNKILICIFQRGAVDGLSMVVPYGDPYYYQSRTDISLPAPSQAAGANGVLDLDGYFGFNPALAPLLPLFKQGHLAAIQACGSPNASRSHFESQDLMESGIDEDNGVRDGWLNRLLGCCPEDAAEAHRLPRRLHHRHHPAQPPGRAGFPRHPRSRHLRPQRRQIGHPSPAPPAPPTASKACTPPRSTPSCTAPPANRSTRSAAQAKSAMANYTPANGAAYPQGAFGKNLRQIAQLIKANVGVQVAFAEVDGWDTHANQGNAKGVLATRLGGFAQALAALHQDLGDRMADVVVVTMSEFGRTVHQNGNRGTDHGHGTCFFAMGGAIKGGKVYGDWPTLAPDKLFQNRDLPVTTDFREVFGEIVSRHFGVPMSDMPKLFPQYAVNPSRFRNFYAT